MKTICHILLSAALLAVTANAEESAKDLAAKLSALQQDGSSYVRLKLNIKPGDGSPKYSLQLQVKQRRTANSTELVYQILWPKDRAGQAVLLKQSGNKFSGAVFTPPNTVKVLTSAQKNDSLFGSALSYADVLENFFTWDDQKITGTETVDKVSCQILDSKGGKGTPTVRTWVDTRRLVPMKVEKFLPSGKPDRRIVTTQVNSDDMNRNIPSFLEIQNFQSGTSTEIDGSKLKHGVKYDDSEFTPAGLGQIAPPR